MAIPSRYRQTTRHRDALDEIYRRLDALAGSVPVGTVLAYFGREDGSDVPTGFVLPRGQVVGRAQYPALFDKFGTRYNGSATVGDDSFRLPDLRNRFIQFASNSLDTQTRIGNYLDDMDITTAGGDKILRFIMVPIMRAG